MNVEYARKVYSFLENDLNTCLEYVQLTENHLDVYSFKFADLLSRIGPEILRVSELFLFNPRRGNVFFMKPELQQRLIDLQRKKATRRDNFMDYLNAFAIAFTGLNSIAVEIAALNKYVVPFRTENRKGKGGKEVEVISWWEDGYNSIKHRIISEFQKSATLKHTLFSLAALWVLHDCLDRDHGRLVPANSEIFGRIKSANLVEEAKKLQ